MAQREHMNPVFVYGSLRQNKCSTHVLQGFRLYDLGPFPAIIRESGYSVKGNVILVSDDELIQLDRVEGVKRGFYTREVVSVRCLPGWKCKSYDHCFVYVAGDDINQAIHAEGSECFPVKSGDWHEHPNKAADVFSPYIRQER